MKIWIYVVGITVFAGLGLSCSEDNASNNSVPETEKEPTLSHINGYVFKPALAPASEENIQQLKVPEGFQVHKFAGNLGNPRMLAVSNEGYVYTSDPEAGTVTLLQDTDGDGVSDRKETVAKIEQAHGLAIHRGKMYIAAVRKIFAADIHSAGTLGEPQLLTDKLPDGGQHPNRTLAFGPDGMMYITVGSTCNACSESNKMNGTIVRANPDGTDLTIFAKGLRNTIGFGWHPETNEMWGMDHGIDWLGDDEQKEELNKLKQDADYGWPYIYGEGKYNPGDRPLGDTTYQEYLNKTTLPVLTYQAHAAPIGWAFYTGSQFPEAYINDAFVVMRGSWNRSSPVGYKVVRLHFENGEPTTFDDFLTGFLINDNRSHFGRLAGIAVHTDGSLLLTDDTNGVIYRVTH